MNATEISAEIARLFALLPAAIRSEDFDGDIAVITAHLAAASKAEEAALDALTEFAENSDGWEAVAQDTASASFQAVRAADFLKGASEAARMEQGLTAAQVRAALATPRH